MRKLLGDTRLIFKCCSLYYKDGMGQKAICERLGISRPTVSRLLTEGRKTGIVKIVITNPDNALYGEMEHELELKYDLQEVIITDAAPLEQGTKYINSLLGRATLQFLSRVLVPNSTVGVTMGMTLQNVVRSDYPVNEIHSVTFVPLCGGVDESRNDVLSNSLAQEFAVRFGGKSVQFFSPALFSKHSVMENFMKEYANRNIRHLFQHLDIALMGIGVLDKRHSTMLQNGYIDLETAERFERTGAVGDIALRYFNKEGQTEPFHDLNERVSGISLDELIRVPRRIGIAGGTHKADAVLGAIHGKFINILITDIACAEKLLAEE